MKKPTLASFYSGCGGSALGFKNAGFKIVFMTDKDKDACKTLEKNFKIKPIMGDIKKIGNFEHANVIEGGFPCQGFSVAGPRKKTSVKRKSKNRAYNYVEINDDRNALYHYLKQAISLSEPDFFVAENVKGFVSIGEKPKKVYNKKLKKTVERSPGPFFKDGKIVKLGKIAQGIITDLELDGRYVVKYELHNAKDFGIPQERERIIIVGIRKDVAEKFEFKFPEPTHGPDSEEPYVTLESIREVKSKDEETFRERKENQDDYFGSRYMSRNRVKKWNELSFTIPAEAMQVPAQPDSKMWDTKDGNRPLELKDEDWAKKRKEYESKISKKLRRLSYKQCAKIQGFDEEWKFYPIKNATKDLISKYRQIGNAVPPLLMQKVAECIIPFYKGKKSSF